MRKLNIRELRELLIHEVKQVAQLSYPEGRVSQAKENLKNLLNKDARFASHVLLATLVDMSFAKLHTQMDKDVANYWRDVYLKTKELLDFVKDNDPHI